MGQKSGHQKRKEKEKDEKITRSLRETLDSFLIRNSQVGDNRNDHDDDGVVNNVDEVENETNEHDQNETNDHNLLNIYDPRFWDALDQRSIDILAKNGPRRDLSIVKGNWVRDSDLITVSCGKFYEPNHYTITDRI
uniref:Uncharacterized protein n=1 Tax=Noccaea caerulescens TaxID=107243 RepID=A0A1J3JJG9_NOCCA